MENISILAWIDVMSKNKKRILLILLLVVVGCFAYVGYSTYRTHHTGARSGKVIDPNGNPIVGAVVVYNWKELYGSPFLYTETQGPCYETLTDEDGKYYIPDQYSANRIEQPEEVLVYKFGYSAYVVRGQSSRVYTYIRPKKRRLNPYRKKNNIVVLTPWRKGFSHKEHLDKIFRKFTNYGRPLSCWNSKLLIPELKKEDSLLEPDLQQLEGY